ncbi:glycosyltransferase [Granulicella sp. 5B5]|uniref:glycosyltransferase family 4 protein n=1 Tax=Granulicella sp. 5B5 TaxID=1617967 RepID=UPI0015F72D1B|nr:glycosyltransferase family 4 protein [Granulicella sp. 5B5]QMV19566.1 glycosyltransferase [Granulicella sp. 5B5]
MRTPDYTAFQHGNETRPVRLAYVVSHPIQYQAPLLRRIAQEPDIALTVLFGSDFSVRGYKDAGFGVEVNWDVPLLEGYKSEFLPALRDNGTVSMTSPISHGIYRHLQNADGSPAFDALWVHGYASINALQAILAAKMLGIPVLLRAEGWLGDRERSGWKLALKRLFFSALRGCIDATLPIGQFNAEYWRHYFGDAVPQFPMPYAVDNDWFAQRVEAAAQQAEALRTELRLEPGRSVVLFASKLQARKHADHLVAAYARFTATCAPEKSPYLVIVGDGEERPRLEAECQKLELQHVRFAGFRNQTELPVFFRLANVFVLPSRHEPWGLIVNEAMASGRAVIVSSDVGSHADLVTDGVQGCVYPVGDVEALMHALSRVLTPPGASRAMGDAARERMKTWSFEEDVRGLRAALAYTTGKLTP